MASEIDSKAEKILQAEENARILEIGGSVEIYKSEESTSVPEQERVAPSVPEPNELPTKYILQNDRRLVEEREAKGVLDLRTAALNTVAKVWYHMASVHGVKRKDSLTKSSNGSGKSSVAERASFFEVAGVVPVPPVSCYSARFNLLEVFGRSWTNDDVVLEIGCGNGNFTRKHILRIIKHFSVYYAIDSNPTLIQAAFRKNDHPRVQYRLADVGAFSTFKMIWLEKFTKIISIQYFQSLKSYQRLAFENIYRLMAPNAVAHVLFNTWHPYWAVSTDLLQLPYWRDHVTDTEYRIPASHEFNLGPETYRKVLEDMNFEVLKAEERISNLYYKNMAEFQSCYKKFCQFYFPAMPIYKMESLMISAVKSFSRFARRTSGGQLQTHFKCLILQFRKPGQDQFSQATEDTFT